MGWLRYLLCACFIVSCVISAQGENVFAGIVRKVNAYLKDTTAVDTTGKVKFSMLGGPYYNTTTKFGIGLVGTSQFFLKGCDWRMQPSNATIYLDVTSAKFADVGMRGNVLFANNSKRINYDVGYEYFPTDFWGMGRNNGDNDANKCTMERRSVLLNADFMWRMTGNMFLGPSVEWKYIRGDSIDNMELLEGQPLHDRVYSFGATFEWDTRDLIINPYSGFFLHLSMLWAPRWLWNRTNDMKALVQARYYKQVWKGGVVAGELYGEFHTGNPSWATMAKLGGSMRMRGYYAGRYMDKDMVTAQVELRQHVWRRNGIVAWAGLGNVFHNHKDIWHFLPNFGVGYRWEFRSRVNVRLDYGFGSHGERGLIFGLNEAF